MSTDDFEARLRGRLHDLADHEDGWDDPAPAARAYAAAGIAPDDDPAILPPPAPATRRRPWTVLAVAAVLLAFVVGGGLGIRELARTGGSSSGSAAAAGQASPEAADVAASPTAGGLSGSAAPGGGPITGGSGSGLSCPSGPGADCADTVSCGAAGSATSTGPLAGTASIRPSGIVGPRTTSGGSVAVPYQLTFAAAGGTAEIRAAQVRRTDGGVLCDAPGTARPGVVEAVPVGPGGGTSGVATFYAVDSNGSPLPAGEYPVVVVIAYSVDGSALSQLVSAPVTAVVS